MAGTVCTTQLELFEVGRQQVTLDFEGEGIVSDTNMNGFAKDVDHGYCTQLGPVPERSIGELKNGLCMDRLSSPRFLANIPKLMVHMLVRSTAATPDCRVTINDSRNVTTLRSRDVRN